MLPRSPTGSGKAEQMRRSPLIGSLAGLALLTGACSGQAKDPTASQLRDKISKELRAAPGASLTAKQADCYAGLLVQDVGAKVINKIDLKAASPDPAVAKSIATAAIEARSQCDLGGTTTTTTRPG